MKTSTTKNEALSRPAIEGKKLLERIVLQDERYGAKSALILGQPESCKTAALSFFCEYHMNHHTGSLLFWRSALNAPIQIFKLPKWHLFTEKESGIHFFNRHTGRDITEELKRKKKLTMFSDFEDLLKRAKPGTCNGVFFKDLHFKGIKYDEGSLQWFRFIRHLLHSSSWSYLFMDEYQEMVKQGNGERMWYEIDKHSNDISSARKSNTGIYADAHQTSELDWRVIPEFMIILQMYGSRVFRHSLVSKQALSSLKKPDERYGAESWICEGSHFGKITFKKVYILPSDMSIEARIVSEDEHTKVCPVCHHIYVYKRKDQVFCSRACQEKDARTRKNK
jgi:hypothetical protein